MIEKLKVTFNKKMPMPVFYGFVIALGCLTVIYYILGNALNNDMCFMIATGREILENGIPHTNVWTIDKSSGFVAQQWLYDVVLALLDKIGYVGFCAFILVEMISLIALLYHFFRLKNVSKGCSFLFIAVCLLCTSAYSFSIRPELITMILLVIECVALEHYSKSGKWQWLILLPITMLLEVNLHSSMVVMHYAIILAYICPAFYYRQAEQNDLHKQWLPISIATIIMTAVMWINPYGTDAVLYLYKTQKAYTFTYVQVSEVQSPDLLSDAAIVIFALVLAVLVIRHKCHRLKSVSLNMALGFSLIVALQIRNIFFCLFIFMYLFSDVYNCFHSVHFDWQKDVKAYLYLIFIPVVLLSINNVIFTFANNLSVGALGYCTPLTSNVMANITEYLSKNADYETRLFTDFNTGGYFEYLGYKNVYFDARPEIYTSEFTGDKNILRDYSSYVQDGCRIEKISFINGVTSVSNVTAEDMQGWVDEYQFEYFVVSQLSSPYLLSYLTNSPDYEYVPGCSDDETVLFHRVTDY